MGRGLRALQALALSCVAHGGQAPPLSHYDVVVMGGGLKESLLAGLLATHGKTVLQLDDGAAAGMGSLDLQELAEITEGAGVRLSEQKLGSPSEYSIERAPKMFMAGGAQLQMLVASGAWQHMNPPGFKRVHRSLMYRRRADGNADVHRVLANSEDVLKTRSLATLDKARVVQFFLWIERYDESDPRTHATGPLSKVGLGSGQSLDLHKMSAAKFLAFWELSSEARHMVTRGMALQGGPAKRLKRMPALDLVHRLKRYKDAYRTFPHMTSPYVYPVGGFGASLPQAMAHVLEENGGTRLSEEGCVGEVICAEGGGVTGVTSQGTAISADCVVSAPEYSPGCVTQRYQIVRLYAVLSHPPNLCKDATSCQLLLPGRHCGRAHDVYLSAYGALHRVAPKGKWVVVVSARVEGSTEGLDALEVAKRELAAALPLLKPTRKLFAEVVPYYEPSADALPAGMHVLASSDETSYFDSIEADLDAVFQQVTGEELLTAAR